jgi:hypothetical protein
MTTAPRRPVGRRLVGIGLCTAGLLAIGLGTSSCGTAGGGSTQVAPSTSALCDSTAALDGLTVHRVDAFPQNHLVFSIPADSTLTTSADVRAVARAVCGLPPMPTGTYSCPADLGVVQQLAFFAGKRAFPEVTISAWGCTTVRGAGQTRWTPGPVWAALGTALGLTPPYDSAFAGTVPTPR